MEELLLNKRAGSYGKRSSAVARRDSSARTCEFCEEKIGFLEQREGLFEWSVHNSVLAILQPIKVWLPSWSAWTEVFQPLKIHSRNRFLRLSFCTIKHCRNAGQHPSSDKKIPFYPLFRDHIVCNQRGNSEPCPWSRAGGPTSTCWYLDPKPKHFNILFWDFIVK